MREINKDDMKSMSTLMLRSVYYDTHQGLQATGQNHYDLGAAIIKRLNTDAKECEWKNQKTACYNVPPGKTRGNLERAKFKCEIQHGNCVEVDERMRGELTDTKIMKRTRKMQQLAVQRPTLLQSTALKDWYKSSEASDALKRPKFSNESPESPKKKPSAAKQALNLWKRQEDLNSWRQMPRSGSRLYDYAPMYADEAENDTFIYMNTLFKNPKLKAHAVGRR